MKPLPTKRRGAVRKLAGRLALPLALAFFQSSAFAHAHLVRSRPAANATLTQAPKTVELWFSEELAPDFNTVAVTDRNGKRVDKDDTALAEGAKKLQISLQDLAPGTYTVDWKNLSADQHTMKGRFSFTVALAETGAVTPAATVPPAAVQKTEEPKRGLPATASGPSPAAEAMQESGSGWAMSLVRWLEYLAMMILFGGFAFRLLVLGPSLREARGLDKAERGAALSASARRFVRLSWWGVALLLLTTPAALVLQTSAVLDTGAGTALSPSKLYRVITQTGYGGPWLLQVVSLFLLALVLLLLRKSAGEQEYASRQANPGLLWAGLVVTAGMMLSPSLTGHARAAAVEYHFTVFSDWLHMVAAGVWVGGLFHLALTMTRGVSGLRGRQRLRILESAIPLFTRLAIASIAVIALTGIYNSWIHLDRISALWSTPYGEALLIKIIIFVVMVALGGLNTFVIHPKVQRLTGSDDGTATSDHLKLDRSFYRSVGVEAVLGVVVLLVAAVLVFLQPAREHPTTTTRAKVQDSVSVQEGR